MRTSALELVSLPGGRVTVGLRASDLRTVDAIEPGWAALFSDVPRAHDVTIEPFRVTRHPLSNGDLRRAGFGARVEGRDDELVARVGFDDARRIAAAFGGRLPTEVEWEYLCRANAAELFPFDVSRLHDDSVIEPWMAWRVNADSPENAFGLRVLFTGEWCEATGPEPMQCGGGAYFWPWQDREWVWCMPTARAPERDLPEGTASFRVVIAP